MRYAAYGEVTGTPHVVVDGSAQAGTVLTLSHWPGTPTPESVRADLSAEIAFAALEHPELLDGLEVVTNNHFDQDGLVGVFALVDPVAALARRERLVDVARAGDFGCFHERDAARAAITIAELGAAVDGDAYPEVLDRLVEIVDHVDRFRDLWAEEDAHIGATEDAIEHGTITLEEVADIDLAVVTVPPDWAARTVHRFTTTDTLAAHPYAVHNATDCLRILTVGADAPELRFRYETWVHLVSRRPVPRVDLTALATRLTAEDPAGGEWVFDPIDGLSPALHRLDAEPCAGDPGALRRLAEAELRRAETTWSPY